MTKGSRIKNILCMIVFSVIFSGFFCFFTKDAAVNAATEEEKKESLNLSRFKSDSEKNFVAELKNENNQVSDYYILPFEKDVPGVNPSLSFKESKNMLVKNKYLIGKSTITTEDYNVESAYPCEYSDIDRLSQYLNTQLPPTRNQYQYGLCWAFSSAFLMESYMLRNNTNNEYGNITKDTIDLSELQLAYFTFHNNTNPIISGQENDYFFTIDNFDFFNRGGNLYFSGQSLLKWRGAVNETDLPYNSLKNSGKDQIRDVKRAIAGIDEDFAYEKDLVHLKNAYYISINKNPKQVKEAIKENGGVGFSIYADNKYYDSVNNSYFNYEINYTNHAINIVGWDDNFPKENFKGDVKPENNGAWLIRNSWSVNDKDLLSFNRYFWLSYEDLAISCLDAAYVFETDSNNYDNLYYYDNQIHDIGYYDDINKVSNVYTVNGEKGSDKERVEAVMISTDFSEVDYSISIYSVDENGYPCNRISREPTTGKISFPGTYTIPLNSSTKAEFLKGQKYAIVVETCPGKYINLEMYIDAWNDCLAITGKNPGESFVYDINTDSWIDLTVFDASNDSGNFCISPLTNNTGIVTAKIQNFKVKEDERTNNSITILWDSFESATGYNIYRSLNSNEFELIKENHSGTNYTDSGIPANSDCSYIVKPIVNGVEKTESASKKIKTAVKPTNDDSLIYTIVDSNIYIEDGYFSYPFAYGLIDDRAYDCEISFKDKNGNWIKLVPGYLQNDNNESYWYIDINSLNQTPGTYDFKVQPYFYNSLFEKGYGKENTGIMLVPYPAPEDFSVVYNEETKEAVLTWSAVNGATKYYLDHMYDDSGLIELGITDKCSYSYVLKDTSPGTLYTFFVNAYDENMNAYSEDYFCSDYSGVTLQIPQLETTPDLFNIIKTENAIYNGTGYPANAEFKEGPVTGAAITVYYKPAEDDNAAWSDVPPVDAGTYSIAIDVSGCKKYKDTEKITDENWKLVIAPKELTILPASGVIKREGDAEPIISFTYLGNVSGETPAFTGALSREAGEAIGEYLITIGDLKPEDNGNFKAKNYILKLLDTNVYMNILEKLLLGDVNADGSVDEYDVIYLKHYLAGGYNVTANPETADIDGDGFITPFDVTLLMRQIVAVSLKS